MSTFNVHKPRYSCLRIRDLTLNVNLGCTQEERAIKQEIRLSVEMRFPHLPSGSFSDSLDETVCYSQVSRVLREHCETREFKLIERIGVEGYSLLKELTKAQDIEICLQVHKVRPPVQDLQGGSHFICGDFLL